MKQTTLIFILIFLALSGFAKKVKFTVDMSGFDIDPAGVHITGDFQEAAGFPGGNWIGDSTPLEQEGETDIYSIVVDIPAFQKYEYRFLNGDGFYGSEFVPWESRVGYEFNDNRWIYVDSLANDTIYVGAIQFGGNAPAGKLLARFVVNMQNETEISSAGVHVAGSFQGWNPAAIRLYSFVDDVYEIIAYLEPGTYEYKFYNGNTPESAEIITGDCTVNGNRQIEMLEDIILNTVCFAHCVDCNLVGIDEPIPDFHFAVYPNPATHFVNIVFPKAMDFSLMIMNSNGQQFLSETVFMKSQHSAGVGALPKGLYFIHVWGKEFSGTARFIKD
jgi:hypothetical protein